MWKYGIIWSVCPVWMTPLDEPVPEPPSLLSELMPRNPKDDQLVLLARSVAG